MTLRRIVLASASPRRLELLRSLGLEVQVRPSAYQEPDDPAATPLELAVRHAHAKLVDVCEHSAAPAAEVIVAADTVVDLDGVALNKPKSASDAERMLRSLSGRDHLVHTAFALSAPGRPYIEEHASTRVRFFDLTDDEIACYVATGEPMDKAGAYGIQGAAAALVASIDGDYFSVMGFPLARFVRALRRLGFSLPPSKNSAVE
jgi:septum formation protein